MRILQILVTNFLVHAVVPQAWSQTQPRGLMLEWAVQADTDRAGGDCRSFDLPEPNPSLCKVECENDPKCLAYTYVKPGIQGRSARCWLKSSVPVATSNDCIQRTANARFLLERGKLTTALLIFESPVPAYRFGDPDRILTRRSSNPLSG